MGPWTKYKAKIEYALVEKQGSSTTQKHEISTTLRKAPHEKVEHGT